MVKTNVMKSGKGRVLFIEDERNLVDMYHDYFINQGYDFLSTKDISEALQIMEFEQPDVVLLDIIIPKEEGGWINMVAEQGYDFLKAVKKNKKTKNAPVIVFTNLDTEEDRKKCEQMGAAAYIFKRDIEPHELLEVIDEVVGKANRRKKK